MNTLEFRLSFRVHTKQWSLEVPAQNPEMRVARPKIKATTLNVTIKPSNLDFVLCNRSHIARHKNYRPYPFTNEHKRESLSLLILKMIRAAAASYRHLAVAILSARRHLWPNHRSLILLLVFTSNYFWKRFTYLTLHLAPPSCSLHFAVTSGTKWKLTLISLLKNVFGRH